MPILGPYTHVVCGAVVPIPDANEPRHCGACLRTLARIARRRGHLVAARQYEALALRHAQEARRLQDAMVARMEEGG